MAEALLVVLGAILLLAGLAGCVLPVLPGPPLAFLALVCLSAARGWTAFGPWYLAAMGALAALVTLLDFVVPAAGARRHGASRLGTWGAVAGMVVGLFLGPFGMLLGALVGAVAGEALAGKGPAAAWNAAWGVFKGTIAGILLKLAVTLWFVYLFVAELL